jgi:hypothetical protein
MSLGRKNTSIPYWTLLREFNMVRCPAMTEQHRRDYEYRTECIMNIYSRPRGQIYRLKDKQAIPLHVKDLCGSNGDDSRCVEKVVQGFETEAVRIGGRHAPLGRLRRARAANINLDNRQELAAAPARADGLVCSQLRVCCRHGIDVVADYL